MAVNRPEPSSVTPEPRRNSPEQAPKVVSLGECMLEIRQQSPTSEQVSVSYGGDTYNTAYALAQSGIAVSYLTALGDDPRSEHLIRQWDQDGVDISAVQRLPGRQPGLYWITTDTAGERHFQYWRQASAATRLLDTPEDTLLKACAGASHIYLSLITAAIVADRDGLLDLLRTLSTDHTIVYDSNFRPQLWASTTEARVWHEQLLALSHIYLPSLDDEMALYTRSEEAVLNHLLTHHQGREQVVRCGGRGARVRTTTGWQTIPACDVPVADSTGAGDAFNGGYLAARLQGLDPEQSARHACGLAGTVVGHPGALLPRRHAAFTISNQDSTT